MPFFYHIIDRLKRIFTRRLSRPEDIPRKLDPETLAQALDTARVLHKKHDVHVQPLSPGELPIPKKATDVGET